MRIGELLIMNGLISEEQLEKALQKQKYTFKKIGEILIEEHLITERQLVEVLEFQLGIPVIDLHEKSPDKATVHLIHESAARKHCVLPIEQKDGKLRVVMADPLNKEAIKEIQSATGMTVLPCLAPRSELESAIISQYGVLDSVKELSEIIDYGIQQNASAVHLDAQSDGLVVRYKINHKLEKQKTIPKQLQEAVIGRLKTLSNMNTTERKLPQTGIFHKKAQNVEYHIRVSTVPTIDGESAVLHFVQQSAANLSLTELGLTDSNLSKLKQATEPMKGLILIAGPAGSGKTTQAYSLLQELKQDERKIVSLENLVKRRIDGVMQVEINEAHGFSYADGLRSVMNHDPNVIMVNDIPDRNTAEAAIRTSLSGRLVIGSIHGTDAIHTIKRLLDMGIEPYLIASSLSSIVGHRIVPRICERCAQSTPATDSEIKLFEAYNLLDYDSQKEKTRLGNFRTFVAANKGSKLPVVRGEGCKICHNSGYKGYIGIQEVLIIDDGLRELILKKSPVEEFKQYVILQSFKTMIYDGLVKAREGITTVDQVLKAVNQ
ncbi:type IV pilus assembly protein PilB [Bacillus oleivorans]|uniref:Type IV pilus assembly protein PilB n=1 Tax=Bacillus oleivorans TaxID=1448271 RepID=A0A285CHZ4_9BACI|nr:GspE/PulE family protein [Bacillus oleivorans]SNX67214.1 type IV pilus assembly protein PilB [Bacillus oleivorans]